ncbi:MAG: ABC transporter ATP-binding protein [Candidatus Aenigmarchaeota archaeon]|nr:ABC transporter ATP-binding protein [Candidatus Aenigmarchaeota archaeon]
MSSVDRPVIQLVGVGKTYDMGEVKAEVLHGIDFSVDRGEFVAIVGASGSGKSTLLQIMGLLDRPTKGKVLINGIDSSKMSDDELADMRGRNIGFVFQFFNLYPTLSARGNVELPMMIQGMPSGERTRRAREILRSVGLSDKEENMPSQLSGGQKQRVSIARALAMEPALILADEPTGNLDSKTGQEVIDMIARLGKGGNRTILVITHDRHIAEHAERIVEIKDGRVISDRKNKNRRVVER